MEILSNFETKVKFDCAKRKTCVWFLLSEDALNESVNKWVICIKETILIYFKNFSIIEVDT